MEVESVASAAKPVRYRLLLLRMPTSLTVDASGVPQCCSAGLFLPDVLACEPDALQGL